MSFSSAPLVCGSLQSSAAWAGMIFGSIRGYCVAVSWTTVTASWLSTAHAVAVDGLPPLHKDPFDRILVAQEWTEGITLLTADTLVAQYPGPVQRV